MNICLMFPPGGAQLTPCIFQFYENEDCGKVGVSVCTDRGLTHGFGHEAQCCHLYVAMKTGKHGVEM